MVAGVLCSAWSIRCLLKRLAYDVKQEAHENNGKFTTWAGEMSTWRRSTQHTDIIASMQHNANSTSQLIDASPSTPPPRQPSFHSSTLAPQPTCHPPPTDRGAGVAIAVIAIASIASMLMCTLTFITLRPTISILT